MRNFLISLSVLLCTAIGVFADNYTPVEYISADGIARENAMISDYIPVTATTIKIGFEASAGNGWTAIFCGRNKDAGTGISLYKNGDDTHFGYFTGGTTGGGDAFADFKADTRYDVEANVAYLKWSTDGGANWQTKETGNSVTNATTRCLSLFANPENDQPLKGRIYYLTITEGETTYEYKPVMRHDGMLGFLDANSGKFFTAAKGSMKGYGFGATGSDVFYFTGFDKPEVEIGVSASTKITPQYNGKTIAFFYKSADESIATVAADGTITGVKEGETTVIVTNLDETYGEWKIACKVKVANHTPVEYISADGIMRENAMTSTYIPVTSTNIKVGFTASNGDWAPIFCARNGDAGTGISLYKNGNNQNLGYFTGSTTGDGDAFAPFTAGQRYDVEACVEYLRWSTDGGQSWEEKGTGNTDTNPTTRCLSLFANPEKDAALKGRIYYLTIEDDDNTYNYKPVMRHDGTLGFYDADNGLFFTAAQGSMQGYGYGSAADGTFYLTGFEKSTIEIGEAATAQIVPTYVGTAAAFTYQSADESIATVAADGTVTGVKEGKTTVTVTATDATYGTWTRTCTVEVVDQSKLSYTPLEYIESTGAEKENAYTTSYIPKENTVVDIKFNSYSSGNWRAIFSGRNGADAATGISLYQNGDGKHFGYFVGGFREDNFVADVKLNHDYVVSASLAGLVVDGETYNTNWTSFNGTSRGISMFGNPENDNPYRGRIYYMTIKEGDNTVREYKPVLRHDGAFGYLDNVTKEFVLPAKGKLDGYGYGKTATDTYVEVAAENMFPGYTTPIDIVVTNGNKDDYTVTYTSETPDIVTIDGNTLTGVAAGEGKITAVVINKNDATDVWKITKTVKVLEATRVDVNRVGYVAIEGGAGYSGQSWDKLCDSRTDTKYCGEWGNAWVTIQAAEPVAMSTYTIVTGGDTGSFPERNPLSWKISGSNDNVNWTVLDTKNEAYGDMKALDAEEITFTVNDETKYRYFKYESVSSLSNCIQISEIWINGQEHKYGDAKVTASTCTKMGTSVETCAYTGANKTTYLPLEAHAYVDGICSVCGQSALTKVLLADGQTNPYTAKFQHAWRNSDETWPDAADENWNKTDFDDSAWGEITMPVGTYGVKRTYWNNEYNNFWFRRSFTLDAVDENATYTFKLLHDDNTVVYLNGNEIVNKEKWTEGTNWEVYTIDASKFQKGTNVLAVYIQQNTGGAYFDCSLTEYIPVIISDIADNKVTAGKGTVKLTRSFNDAAWNSMVLPFAMDAAKISDVFGADAKVAEYTGTTANENGTVTLNFSTATEIKANVPVLIFGATAVENKELADIAVVEATPTAEPAGAAYTFVGTYAQATAQAGEWLLNADNSLQQAEGTEAVKATSAIFHSVDGAEVKGLSISIDGDVVIDNIDIATLTEQGKGDVYNLNGVKLNGNGLPKGIYIVGGKKLVVK